MEIDKMTVGEFKEMAKLFTCVGGKADSQNLKDPGGAIRIVVLHRGWVVVGKVHQCGAEVEIRDGHVIRIWGTTKGLGELAESGPLASTKLDKISTVRTHQLGVIASIDCNESKWRSVCQ